MMMMMKTLTTITKMMLGFFEGHRLFFSLIFRLGSTPELTGSVTAPALMGAPAIIIERLQSGRETISALKAASGVLLSGKALKERDAGDGTREVECAQDLLSVKNEVLGLPR